MIHKIVHLEAFFIVVEFGGGGRGGKIVLNLIDILEELDQSEIFVKVSIIIIFS